MSAPKILGYRPILEHKPGAVTTRAFIICARCGASIAAHGGPILDALCLKCMPTPAPIRPDCPHAAPFRFCPHCPVDPCPIGMDKLGSSE